MHPQMSDICRDIDNHLKISQKSFSKFRRSLNGDGTLRYRTNMEVSATITLTEVAYNKMVSMMLEAAEDNLERPFFVIFDEEKLLGFDLVVGLPGDEESCEHTVEHVAAAQRVIDEYNECFHEMESTLKMSVGHTHPVNNYESSVFGGAVVRGTTKYGAFPSDIMGKLDDWQSQARESTGNELLAIEEIIRSKAYKHHSEDYIESYYSSHRPGFLGGCDNVSASKYHWICTPRMHQIGVFEVPEDDYGSVVYHPWELARGREGDAAR
jgi:hypothetical protein